ncbi:MAG: Ig-like domain-containing protein [Gemmatimonadaceae bacterium]
MKRSFAINPELSAIMRLQIVSLFLAATAGVGCFETDAPSQPEDYNVELSVAQNAITVGQDTTIRITPTVTETIRGTQLPNTRFSYASSDITIATVTSVSSSSSADIRGISGGTAIITVTYQDPFDDQVQTEQITVTVTGHPAEIVSLTPETKTLFPGDVFKFTAVAITADGDTVYCNCFPSSRGSLRDVQFFFVDADAAQATRITVSSNGTVTAKDSSGTFQLVFHVGADNRADTSTITLARRPATSIEVTPDPAAVEVGGTVQLTATLKAANGQTLTARAVTWASSNELIATVDADGTVTGILPGVVTITATSTLEPISDTVSVSVVPASP